MAEADQPCRLRARWGSAHRTLYANRAVTLRAPGPSHCQWQETCKPRVYRRDSRQGPPDAAGEHRQQMTGRLRHVQTAAAQARARFPARRDRLGAIAGRRHYHQYSQPLSILFAFHFFLSTALNLIRWGGTEPSECLGARNLASWATIVVQLWMAQQPEAGSTGPGIAFRRMDFRRDIRSRWRCSASSQC